MASRWWSTALFPATGVVGAILSPTEAGTPTLRDTPPLYGSGLMRSLTLDGLLLHLFLKTANEALQFPEPLGTQL